MKSTCEGCKYLATISGHPWNKEGTFTHGRVSDIKCYGCSVFLEEEKRVWLMDDVSIGCEMYMKDDNG